MRYIVIIGLAAVLAACDQLSKWIVQQHILPHERLEITSFFNLVNVRNHGAAFGFLNNPEISWQFWIFLVATLLAVLVIFVVAKGAKPTEKALFFALGCILGGAVGNLTDRIRWRSVVDFLDFHYAGWHWPAFNVADMAICFGAGLTALLILRQARGQDTTAS